MNTLHRSLLRAYLVVAGVVLLVLLPEDRRRDDRGDVPGWVMITVMSAAIVAVLTSIATPALRDMLQGALSSVR